MHHCVTRMMKVSDWPEQSSMLRVTQSILKVIVLHRRCCSKHLDRLDPESLTGKTWKFEERRARRTACSSRDFDVVAGRDTTRYLQSSLTGRLSRVDHTFGIERRIWGQLLGPQNHMPSVCLLTAYQSPRFVVEMSNDEVISAGQEVEPQRRYSA